MTTAIATSEAFDPALLRALRAAPWRTIEKRFLFVLAASIAAHVCFAAYIAAQPAPKFDEGLETAPVDRFQVQRLPPLLKIPTIPNLPVKSATASARPAPAAPKSVGEQRAVAKGAIDKMFGGGAMLEVLGAPGDIHGAMQGLQGQQNFGNVGPAGPKGPSTGQTQGIDPIGTDGVKQVNLGSRLDKVPLETKTGPIDLEPTDELDVNVVQRFIQARRTAVQGCYEREIKRNRMLQSGKITIRLVIDPRGRVARTAIENDTLGSGVANCMTALMGRWIFPVDLAEEVPVTIPFIFSRAL